LKIREKRKRKRKKKEKKKITFQPNRGKTILKSRELLLLKNQELKKGDWEKQIPLSEETKIELKWWLENCCLFKSITFVEGIENMTILFD